MKYAFPQLKSKTMFQTYNIVTRVLRLAGHMVTDEIEPDTDAVLFSACDVLDMVKLRALRKQTKKTIIVGGSFAFNYWSAILYSDIVWIGEVFEFADLQNIEDIKASSHAYYRGCEKELIAAQRIDWEKVPVTQVKKNRCYFWAGVGCKNKCRFCFTSWTHKHQETQKGRTEAAIRLCRQKHIHLMVTSNQYDNDTESRTKDMLLVDYIAAPVSGSVVRVGIEFAAEETRRKMGKPITQDQIYRAIQKMSVDHVSLKLFHITGYESLETWDRYINDLCEMFRMHPNRTLFQMELNNLQYQNYTPLYTERRSINPDNYATIKTARAWYDRLRAYSPHVLVGAPSPFVHVAARMGIELAGSVEQSEYWFWVLTHKDKVTSQAAYDNLFSSGVFDQQYRKININTGAIRVAPNEDL